MPPDRAIGATHAAYARTRSPAILPPSAFLLPPSATTLGLTERYPRISEQRLTFTPLGVSPWANSDIKQPGCTVVITVGMGDAVVAQIKSIV
jgi:hypothetical protein